MPDLAGRAGNIIAEVTVIRSSQPSLLSEPDSVWTREATGFEQPASPKLNTPSRNYFKKPFGALKHPRATQGELGTSWRMS